jgi:hypothetical protein
MIIRREILLREERQIKMKRKLAIAISIALINTTLPTREVEASWFSDLMGGIFTVITSPILLVAPNNPTLRKNNPFRKKMWEEEAEKEKEAEKILRRLPTPQCVSQPATQQQPETIVIEKTVEVVKDNSAEINELKKEIDEMKKDVGEKTIEISIMQHIVANVRNGRDGRDGKDAEKVAVVEPATQLVVPTTERDLRKFKALAIGAAATWAINKYFYVRPRIWAEHGDFIYEDRATRFDVFLKTSAIVLVGYLLYKYVNKRLSTKELWTDAKGLASETWDGVVVAKNWTVANVPAAAGTTWNGTKNYVLYPVKNKTIYAWENRGVPIEKAKDFGKWLGRPDDPFSTTYILFWVSLLTVVSVVVAYKYLRKSSEVVGFDLGTTNVIQAKNAKPKPRARAKGKARKIK